MTLGPNLLLAGALWTGLTACAPKEAPPLDRAATPAPLAPRAFALPDVREATLSNGLRIRVVENHEVPLVNVRIAFEAGSWTDPADMPGLASAAMDMLDEGAAGKDALALSTAKRRLAADLWTGAGLDGASIGLRVLRKNVEPALDLMADILLEPTFAASDWELMRKKRLADLKTARDDPQQISGRVWSHLLFGPTYAGHLETEDGYARISPDAMRSWHAAHLVPAHALVLVGGDTTTSEMAPLLESHFGTWGSPAKPAADIPLPGPEILRAPQKTRLWLVDKPGAPQSVVRVGTFVGDRTDPEWASFHVADRAVGGLFTSRINLNLREEKGWTYGARSGSRATHLPMLWSVSTAVKTDATAGSVAEILRELRDSRGSRPLSAEEVDAARGYLLGTWPLPFENPDFLLGQIEEVWRYHLPADWIAGWPDRVRAVDVASASGAWAKRVDPDRVAILVVGDAATVREGLAALGFDIVELDRDGNPV